MPAAATSTGAHRALTTEETDWTKTSHPTACGLAAFLMPVAAAHAQSSVTIYGLLDAAVTSTSAGNGAGTSAQLASGV